MPPAPSEELVPPGVQVGVQAGALQCAVLQLHPHRVAFVIGVHRVGRGLKAAFGGGRVRARRQGHAFSREPDVVVGA